MNEKKQFLRPEEVEPLCLLRLLGRNLVILLMAALIGVMGTWVVLDSIITRTYTSTATFVVTPRTSAGFYYTNTSTAGDVAKIYSELLESSAMSHAVHEVLPDVTGSIKATQLGETNLIRVTASSPSPRDALRLIQAVVDNAGEVSDYVSSTAVLTVLDAPSLIAVQARSFNRATLSLLAALLCVGGVGFLLVWVFLRTRTVQNSNGAKNHLDARILAAVPHEKSGKPAGNQKGKRLRGNLNISSPAVSFPFVESIHRVAAKFEHEYAKGRKVFLFSSVSEGEGKSTLAANTALSLARRKYRVLFLDLDLRRPVQNEFFGLKLRREEELGARLSAGTAPDEILAAAVHDPVTGMDTLLSAHSYVDSIERIASPLLAQAVALAKERYDFIILDSPPLGYFSDSEVLSDLTDASVLVVRQDLVPAPELNDAIDALRAGKGEFLGCVLNDMRHIHTPIHGYGYGYGYEKGKYGKHGPAAPKGRRA